MRYPLVATVVSAAVLLPHTARAQAIETLGTRPAGMAGAFVAVADDASAVYWNPGGLAAASFFSLVLDRTEGRTATSEPSAASRSGFLIALAAPSLGLSYYRLRATTVSGPDLAIEPTRQGRHILGPGEVRLDTLVTHHAGITLVQSIADGIAVGTTLKLVRGTAASGVVRDDDRKALLGDSMELPGRASMKFDADIGVLASSGSLRAGLTIRNVTEPEFDTGGEDTLGLQRQARAGVAVVPMPGWILAADFDLLKNRGAFGEMRDAAFGVEGRLARRAFARGGVRFNTLGDSAAGRAASTSLGGTYAVKAAFLVDAQVTVGSKRSARGWGIGGRFLY